MNFFRYPIKCYKGYPALKNKMNFYDIYIQEQFKYIICLKFCLNLNYKNGPKLIKNGK